MENIMPDGEVKNVIVAAKECATPTKQVVYTIEGGNDWTKVAQKFFGGLVASFLAIGIPYSINFLQTEDLSALPSWFIATVPVIVALLLAANNAWNHRTKITRVEP
jgi:hypothetical protein